MYSKEHLRDCDVWYHCAADKFLEVIGFIKDTRNGDRVIVREIVSLSAYISADPEDSVQHSGIDAELQEFAYTTFISGAFLPVDWTINDKKTVVSNIINFGVIPIRRPGAPK